jgi:hypothetical protein
MMRNSACVRKPESETSDGSGISLAEMLKR